MLPCVMLEMHEDQNLTGLVDSYEGLPEAALMQQVYITRQHSSKSRFSL